MDDKTLLNCI